MQVWTAQYRYPGPHRIDITVKGKDSIGYAFAPTWDMVKDYKNTGDTQVYIQKYHDIIINSYNNYYNIWKHILQQEKVVLVCFCRADDFCHRHLLANYLQQLGATSMGEITDFSSYK